MGLFKKKDKYACKSCKRDVQNTDNRPKGPMGVKLPYCWACINAARQAKGLEVIDKESSFV